MAIELMAGGRITDSKVMARLGIDAYYQFRVRTTEGSGNARFLHPIEQIVGTRPMLVGMMWRPHPGSPGFNNVFVRMCLSAVSSDEPGIPSRVALDGTSPDQYDRPLDPLCGWQKFVPGNLTNDDMLKEYAGTRTGHWLGYSPDELADETAMQQFLTTYSADPATPGNCTSFENSICLYEGGDATGTLTVSFIHVPEESFSNAMFGYVHSPGYELLNPLGPTGLPGNPS